MKISKEDIAQLVIEASDKGGYSDYSSALIMGIDDFYAKMRHDMEVLLTEVIYQVLNDMHEMEDNLSENT